MKICTESSTNNNSSSINNSSSNCHSLPINQLFDNVTPSLPLSEINKIIHHKFIKNKNVFLIKYKDQSSEWVHLPHSHHLVSDYLHSVSMTVSKSDCIQYTGMSEIRDFCNFDRLEMFDDKVVDLFDDDVDKRAIHRKKQIEEKRLRSYVHRNIERIQDVTYTEGDKYHDTDSSEDDDIPVINLMRHQSKYRH